VPLPLGEAGLARPFYQGLTEGVFKGVSQSDDVCVNSDEKREVLEVIFSIFDEIF
jgi:hypothetical protein